MLSLEAITEASRAAALLRTPKTPLLSLGNPKIQKSVPFGYLTAVLHLAPHKMGGRNLCPNASPGCIALCLNTAGRGGLIDPKAGTNTIQTARVAKSVWLREGRSAFLAKLHQELDAFTRKCSKLGILPAVRLNGTSDLPWEAVDRSLFDRHPTIQFYDYTKSTQWAMASLSKGWPTNYHLTLSRSETNGLACLAHLAQGGTVAAIVADGADPLPYPTIDGDAHDLRFLDPPSHIVTLSPKGRAKHDQTRMVLRQGGAW